MGKISSLIKNNFEKLKLVGYFTVMISVSGPLFTNLGAAWKSSLLIKPVILSLRPILGINLEEFAMVCIGVYLGLLILITIDPKKRWQAALLWIGTVTGIVALSEIGLLLPNLEPTQSYGWALGGSVVGAVAGGGRRLTNLQSSKSLEFRRAGSLLFYIMSILVIIGLLEYHIETASVFAVTGQGLVVQTVQVNPQPNLSNIYLNVAFSGVFLYTLNKFVEYDAERDFFVLGPRGSGKSLFLVGAFRAALRILERDFDNTRPSPSSDLMTLVGALEDASQNAGWNLAATGASETQELSFQYVSGRIFPKNISISSLDYAGEFLDQLPNALLGGEGEIDDPTLSELSRNVVSADTLVFLVDCERYERGDNLEIEPYFDIIEAVPDKEIIIVATKADILAREYRDERGLDADQYFEEFTDYVNEKLANNSDEVRALVQGNNTDIYPVYYKTTEDETGERIPMRDRNGNVETRGFEQLINKLG